MSTNEPWSIGRLLTWTTNYLKEHGAENPRLDAEVLLSHARGCQRIDLYTAYGETAPDELRARFRELVRQRAEGTPVAHLVGQREFFSLPFRVTADVLIPRPETEFLVMALLDLAKTVGPAQSPLKIVDVGTGSGIIAICAARQLPEARVWGTDTSAAALAVAAENCRRHEVQSQVCLLEGDLLDPVPDSAPLDFVVSNPPYVSRAEYDQLERDVRSYEPEQALVAGERGTEVIERLVPAAAERLGPGRWLLVEISPMIEEAVGQIVEASQAFASWEITPDLAGLPRVLNAVTRS